MIIHAWGLLVEVPEFPIPKLVLHNIVKIEEACAMFFNQLFDGHLLQIFITLQFIMKVMFLGKVQSMTFSSFGNFVSKSKSPSSPF